MLALTEHLGFENEDICIGFAVLQGTSWSISICLQ